jgi:hypothetical protein
MNSQQKQIASKKHNEAGGSTSSHQSTEWAAVRRRGGAAKKTVTEKRRNGERYDVQREVEAKEHETSAVKKLDKQKAQARSKVALRTKRGFAQRPDTYDEDEAQEEHEEDTVAVPSDAAGEGTEVGE